MFKKSLKKTYFLFFALTLTVYSITYKAGFVTDFMGWLYNVDYYPFSTVWNSEVNNIKSFYHFTHLLMYGMTAMFGRSGLPWFLLFSALFSLNALLVFRLFIKIFDRLGIEKGEFIALMGVLLFILSPYQAEVMVWRASFHYLTAFAMMLGFVHLALKYLDMPLLKYILGGISLFICSVFALEFFLFTPFVVAVVLAFWVLTEPKHIWESSKFSKGFLSQVSSRFFTSSLQKAFMGFVFIPLSIIGIYFVFHHAIRGEWFAHGRGTGNLNLFSLETLATYGKYTVKELFFIRYLTPEMKQKIFMFFNTPSVSWRILGALTLISAFSLFYFKILSAKNKALFLCFSLFSLLLVPVLNLYFAWELWSENDRYGYMASAFLFMGFALVLSKLPNFLFYLISILYLLLSSYFLIKTNRIWWKSEKVYSQISETFHWWDADKILILNAPDNYAGIPMFRIHELDSGVREAVEVYHKRPLHAKTLDVLAYNMTSPTDGANVRVESDSVLVVSLNQWGNWWFHKGIGASDYETEDYRVKIDFNGCGRCYKLILKKQELNRIVLFQNGGELKEVDMFQKEIEQR